MIYQRESAIYNKEEQKTLRKEIEKIKKKD
jgi:hypothetical protein